MKIVIASGTYPPSIGGSSYYAYHLAKVFKGKGHDVVVVTYGIERLLPVGIRHIVIFFRILFSLIGSDVLLALDTFSVGVPGAYAAKLLNKPSVLRVGGDFLWEHYVNRTQELIPYPYFYKNNPLFNLKEKIIFFLIKKSVKKYTHIIFNTRWMLDYFLPAYKMVEYRNITIVENVLDIKRGDVSLKGDNSNKMIVTIGRDIPLKNLKYTKDVLYEIKNIYENIDYFVGQTTFEEKERLLSQAYFSVLLSVSDMNPGFILDSIRYGKPFIVTKYNGLSDDIKRLGIEVDPFNQKEIINAINRLLDDMVYKSFKDKIASFSKSYSWDEVGDDFLKILSNQL